MSNITHGDEWYLPFCDICYVRYGATVREMYHSRDTLMGWVEWTKGDLMEFHPFKPMEEVRYF